MQTVEQILATRTKIEALRRTYQENMAREEKEGARLQQEARLAEFFAGFRALIVQLIFVLSQAVRNQPITLEMVPGYIAVEERQHFMDQWREATDFQILFVENLVQLTKSSVEGCKNVLKARGFLYDAEHERIVVLSEDEAERDRQIERAIQVLLPEASLQREIQRELTLHLHGTINERGERVLFNPTDKQIEGIHQELQELEEESARRTDELNRLGFEIMERIEGLHQAFLADLAALPPLPFDGDLIDAVMRGDAERLRAYLAQDQEALNRPLYDSKRDIYGKTLLYLACEYGQLPVVEYLLINKAGEKAKLDIPEQWEGY